MKSTSLKGYIALEGGESFNYKIVFTDSAGIIKGYSLVYAEEKKDVRSEISGNIDRNARTLSFKETSIIYNHGFESNAILCLVDAKLKYARNNNSFVLSGPFASADASNSSCGRGTISFIAEDVLKELFTSPPITDTPKPSKKSIAQRPVSNYRPLHPLVTENIDINPKTEKVPVPDEITNGVDKIYEWHGDTVLAEVWDGGNIDGDIITVLYNNVTVLSHYTLAKEKKTIAHPFIR